MCENCQKALGEIFGEMPDNVQVFAFPENGNPADFLRDLLMPIVSNMPREKLIQSTAKIFVDRIDQFLTAVYRRDTEAIREQGTGICAWIFRMLAANDAVIADDEFDATYGPNADILAMAEDYPFLADLLAEMKTEAEKAEELNQTFPVEESSEK